MTVLQFKLLGHCRRTPQEQLELAVRILEERHYQDVLDQAKKELADRATKIGPIDMTRNPLRVAVDRISKLSQPPPMMFGFPPSAVPFMGDYSGRLLVEKYAAAGGAPLPTSLIKATHECIRYWQGATYAGLLIGYSERSGSMYFDMVSPDCLDLEFHSDNPAEPTVIRHRRMRSLGKERVETVDVYDLSDPESPSFEVYRGNEKITALALAEDHEQGDYFWIDPTGRPFHRIVILGDNRNVYRTNALLELTLGICVSWTHWRAGVRDAGHPQRNAVGLELVGMDTDSEEGASGVSMGPEDVANWRHIDHDKPGFLYQFGPGFDPKVTGEAVRDYEQAGMTTMGLPVNYSGTGGEPTETERKQLEDLIRSMYPDVRRFVSEALLRSIWILNRVVPDETFSPDGDLGVIFREEVEEALSSEVHAADESGKDDHADHAAT